MNLLCGVFKTDFLNLISYRKFQQLLRMPTGMCSLVNKQDSVAKILSRSHIHTQRKEMVYLIC